MSRDKKASWANPKYIREINELRRSGASGIHHDRRTRRNRDRASRRRHSIDDASED